MKSRSNNLLIVLLLIFANSAFAYPVFYKCGPGDKLEESFAGPELLEYVESMLAASSSEEEFEQKAMVLCMGAKECLEDIEKMKALINSSKDITTDIMNRVSRMQTNTAAKEVDEEKFNQVKNYVDAAYTLRACHEVKETWSVDNWMKKDDPEGTFAVFYPKHNNYMYASGCFGKSSSSTCLGNRAQDYKDRLESALLMGMDPYLAIALAWMEGGTDDGLNYLYLDPIGKFAGMGCTSTPVHKSKSSSTTLYSYGTYYNIHPKTIRNAALGDRLKKFITVKDKAPKAGTSYFCRKINDDLGLFFAEPQEGSCCLQLPFESYGLDSTLIEEALVFEQAKKNYQSRFKETNDPAFRVQRFNGYSRLMGGAEGVESFRSGVNHYEDPAYGYQAMDYMINSILTNPVIKKMVDDAEAKAAKALGKPAQWRSIMCVEHPGGGTFQVDSNHYFNLHKDTDRLKTAYEKWKAGKALSEREKHIIDEDLMTLTNKGRIPEEMFDRETSEIHKMYFEKYYPNRNTVGSASKDQSGYTWEDLTKEDLRSIGKRVLGN